MSRLSVLIFPALSLPAFAHEGLHHHPHGIEFGWLATALVGSAFGGGVVVALLRRRK